MRRTASVQKSCRLLRTHGKPKSQIASGLSVLTTKTCHEGLHDGKGIIPDETHAQWLTVEAIQLRGCTIKSDQKRTKLKKRNRHPSCGSQFRVQHPGFEWSHLSKAPMNMGDPRIGPLITYCNVRLFIYKQILLDTIAY